MSGAVRDGVDDVRTVARGWRWGRRRLVPKSAEPYVEPRDATVFPTAWSRRGAARAVREVAQRGVLQCGRRIRDVEIAERFGRIEPHFGIGGGERPLQMGNPFLADRFQFQRRGGGGGWVHDSPFELHQPLRAVGRRFVHRQAPHHANVAADVVLVARVDFQVDPLVAFRRGHALFQPPGKRVEAAVDALPDLRRQPHRFLLRHDEQSDVARP